MLLSQTSEYALRAMAHLAREPEGAWVSGPALAEATRVPAAYVGKVMRQLVVAGLVVGKSGRAGGFRIAQSPGTIRFIDVLEALDAVGRDTVEKTKIRAISCVSDLLAGNPEQETALLERLCNKLGDPTR